MYIYHNVIQQNNKHV